MILRKPRRRIANCPQPPRRQVLLPPYVINDAISLERIEKQSVDRKIPSLCILLRRGESHLRRPPPILVAPIASKRRHLHDAPPMPHQNHSKRRANRFRFREQFPHPRRRRIRGHIPILRLQPQQQIPHAPPGKIRLVTTSAQPAHHRLRIGAVTSRLVGPIVHAHIIASIASTAKRQGGRDKSSHPHASAKSTPAPLA